MRSTYLNKFKSIILVDDELDITTVLEQGLERLGFRVFGITDPLLALEHFQINSDEYGLVISDLRMPEMNGYEFVKNIKKIKPEVRVFLMTAFEINDNEFKKVFQAVDIDEFIQKPISFNELTRMVSKYINIEANVL